MWLARLGPLDVRRWEVMPWCSCARKGPGVGLTCCHPPPLPLPLVPQHTFTPHAPQPCFVQPTFFAERARFLARTCRELRALESNRTNTASAVSDMLTGAQFCSSSCGAAGAPSYCGPIRSLLTYAATANTTTHVPLVGRGRCDDLAGLNDKYLRATSTGTHVDTLSVW